MTSSLLIRAAMAHLNQHRPHEEFMNEALDETQKRKIAAMPNTNKQVKEAHDVVFGKDNDTVEIPYSRENDEKITSENYRNAIQSGGFNSHQTHHNYVFTHLHKHGYRVTDYVNGLAAKVQDGGDSPVREEKIGKILQKTKADEVPTQVMSNTTYKRNENQDGTSSWQLDHRGNKIVDREPRQLTVAQAFTNDPIRAAKKDVKIVVTRSKEGVGGMSTGKGWTSCMNLEDGCNRHYVPHDIRQGTLTAYLVKKGDEKNIDNPAGRINLKQFSTADSSHKIFRPETSVYGAMPKSAHTAIQNWAESVYPHKQDEIYTKHHDLYDDDGKSSIITGNPEHQKIAGMVDRHVNNLMAAHEERRYNQKHDDNDFLSDHVDQYLNNLPEQHKQNIVIHSRLTAQEDPTDKWEGDMRSDDHIAKWAHERRVDWSNIHDTDLMHHLNTAEENVKYAGDYDSSRLEDAAYVHHKLIKEAFKRGSQDIKDKAISHMLDHHNSDWYQEMDQTYGDEIPHLHQHTNNPALIKKIYHASHEGTLPGIVPSPDDIPVVSHGELTRKIGKYGDDDLLHEYTRSEHYNNEYHPTKEFHAGLNDRADGEDRQHKLISELNLGGGSSSHGAVKPVSTNMELKNAQHDMHHEEGYEDIGNDDLYANIAQHTKFKSVHNALSNRPDTKTPSIQSALKDNKNIIQ